MRVCALLLLLTLTAGYKACVRAKPDAVPAVSGLSSSKPSKPAPSATPTARVDFNAQVRPLLESRCTPCHFVGGTMYAHLPFDRPETIKTLGTKLFTRITDEQERNLIKEFLTQQTEPSRERP